VAPAARQAVDPFQGGLPYVRIGGARGAFQG
jgi:hypothetical protein